MTKRKIFRAVTRISFFSGVFILPKSAAYFKISSLFLLKVAIFCNKETNSFCSSIMGSMKASQAAFLPSRTSFLVCISMASISSGEAILMAIIHNFIWRKQSKSFSQASLAEFLYRSCEPELECPCGWVNSST